MNKTKRRLAQAGIAISLVACAAFAAAGPAPAATSRTAAPGVTRAAAVADHSDSGLRAMDRSSHRTDPWIADQLTTFDPWVADQLVLFTS
ncbi:hypothetical protein ACIPSA_44555 [Streptomyces sp. NPDC086549]|uniref:hypothetical protein n=1 Tax=Streptomyces sp. NPDC086549 TaxID=3365752 RepID=UPI003818EFCE